MNIRLAGMFLAFSLGSPAATADEHISFSQNVAPILNRHCVICHMPGDEQGGLGLYPDAHGALVGVPSSQSALTLVEPGSADKSYFYRKLTETHLAAGGSGTAMPFQRPLLDAGDLEIIRLWIEQGAWNH